MAILYRPSAPVPLSDYRVARVDDDADVLNGGEHTWHNTAAIVFGPDGYATRFRAVHGRHGLAIRFDCLDDGPWHTKANRDDRLWEEEVVEIFLDPAAQGRDYAEIEINPANVVCDLRIRQPWPDLAGDIGWNFEGLDSRVEIRHTAGVMWWHGRPPPSCPGKGSSPCRPRPRGACPRRLAIGGGSTCSGSSGQAARRIRSMVPSTRPGPCPTARAFMCRRPFAIWYSSDENRLSSRAR